VREGTYGVVEFRNPGDVGKLVLGDGVADLDGHDRGFRGILDGSGSGKRDLVARDVDGGPCRAGR
jgi:hypothetical protein